MSTLLIWLSIHRLAVVLALASVFWVGSYVYYFRGNIRELFARRKPHNWSVNLATKQATRNGKIEV